MTGRDPKGVPDPPQTTAAEARVPTSAILRRLARDAPAEGVTLAWLIARLGERSFGIVILIIALLGLLPGASPVAGILLTVPAMQMILGRDRPVLPRRVAARSFAAARFVRVVERTAPWLERVERVVRPRLHTPFGATKRVIGGVILVLGATMLAPVPFSHIVPDLTIMLTAFAFLEEDGVLLATAMTLAAASLAITAGAVWGILEAGRLVG